MYTLGIIGGSGLYEMDGLSRVDALRVTTSFGDPSDAIVSGWIGDTRLLFLPRHGRGHRIPPHRLNARANVMALKEAGATHLLSLSAVGSMREEIRPGDLVVIDQLIDRTRSRPQTFFDDDGVVAHVSLADPVDAALSAVVADVATAVVAERGNGAKVHHGGTYVCIDGPQFSTRAESRLFRSWGIDVIGMTALPEARLAREAELPYALVAFSTDYDCWHESEEDVTVEAVLAVLARNVEAGREIVRRVAPRLPDPAGCPATRALAGAIMTSPELITPQARQKLGVLLAKHGAVSSPKA